MRPRLVDWLLFLLVTLEVLSGFITFTLGAVEQHWFFIAHGITGVALMILLYWKLQRVWPRLVGPRRRELTAPASVAALGAVLLTFGTGLVWTTLQWPLGYPNGIMLHVLFGSLLCFFMLWHMVERFKPLHIRDVRGRRNALRLLTMAAGGGLLWQSQQTLNQVLDTAGASRRFTGSRATATDQGNAYPVTMWFLDNPAPFDLTQWQLRMHGAVAQEKRLTYQALLAASTTQLRATLDCTGGWYSTQDWQGVSIRWLLDQVKPSPTAVAVSFVSATGYRWSLPLAEAEATLLAMQVGGELLSHGHGAPLRLVAPGRRGFQWVKWVREIEVLTATDYGQWLAIFTSGL